MVVAEIYMAHTSGGVHTHTHAYLSVVTGTSTFNNKRRHRAILAIFPLVLHSQLAALSRVVYQTAYQDEWQVLGCECVQLRGRRERLAIHFAISKLKKKKNCIALIPLKLFLVSFKTCPKINNWECSGLKKRDLSKVTEQSE